MLINVNDRNKKWPFINVDFMIQPERYYVFFSENITNRKPLRVRIIFLKTLFNMEDIWKICGKMEYIWKVGPAQSL